MKTATSPSQSASKTRKALYFTGAGILLIAVGAAFFMKAKTPTTPDLPASASSGASPAGKNNTSMNPEGTPSAGNSSENAAPPASPSKDKVTEGPNKTKRADRSAPIDRSKLHVVDMEKSAQEIPQWPDGPKVYAEVATESKRLINLRPNSVGIMPTVNIGTEESVALKLSFPENEPGDRIYIELTDGGFFTDCDKPGRVLTLNKSRTLEVPFSSDTRVGEMKLVFRQSGHSRTLPLWVGPLPELASDSSK